MLFDNETLYYFDAERGAATLEIPTRKGLRKVEFAVDDIRMLADILSRLIQYHCDHPEAC